MSVLWARVRGDIPTFVRMRWARAALEQFCLLLSLHGRRLPSLCRRTLRWGLAGCLWVCGSHCCPSEASGSAPRKPCGTGGAQGGGSFSPSPPGKGLSISHKPSLLLLTTVSLDPHPSSRLLPALCSPTLKHSCPHFSSIRRAGGVGGRTPA